MNKMYAYSLFHSGVPAILNEIVDKHLALGRKTDEIYLAWAEIGKEFYSHIEHLSPDGLNRNEWIDSLHAGHRYLHSEDFDVYEDFMTGWFSHRMPQVMSLVRNIGDVYDFVNGVYLRILDLDGAFREQQIEGWKA